MSIDYSKFKGTYTGSSIGIESGLKAVAKQAAMYLGSTGPNGLKYQIGEILDNSIDELTHLNSKIENKTNPLEIELELYENGSVRIKDCGRGIPVGINPKTGRPSIESVFESISAGGKSYNVSNSGYGKVNRGVHGAGAAVVAATSSEMVVIVTTIEDDCTYTLKYGKQERIQELTKIGHMKETKRSYGTEVIWKYDSDIFKSIDIAKEYPYKIREIENMLKLYCYSTNDIKFIFRYTLPGQSTKQLEYNANDYDIAKVIKDTIEGPLLDKELVLRENEYSIRIICGVSNGSTAKYFYTNGLVMQESSQASMFPKLMQKLVKDCITSSKIYTKECPVVFRTESELNYALIVSANNPEYTAQHKNIYEDNVFEQLFERHFMSFMSKEGGDFIKYLLQMQGEKYKLSLAKLNERKKANKKSNKLLVEVNREDLVYVSNLIYSKTPSYMSDLIIVEGNSAGSHAKPLLKPNQALISIQGLFPNALTMKDEVFVNSSLFKPLKEALAFTWKRIVLFSDPDPIGGTIQCLLLVMLYKYYPEYLLSGKVFILKAPLYIAHDNSNSLFLYNETDKENYIKNSNKNFNLIKHKGLGALSAKDMAYILSYVPSLNDTRIDQISPETVKEGTAILETLYGRNPAYRKEYVLSNYATYSLYDYFEKKKSKKESQEIDFNIITDIEYAKGELGYIGNVVTEEDLDTNMNILKSMYSTGK